MNKQSEYPSWVLKHKTKGTEIRQVGNSYYLYKISSVWNPKKKRAQKVTDKYLGSITREGIVKPKHEQMIESLDHITVKEFGATQFTNSISSELIELVKKNYPDLWKEIMAFAIIRLFHASPLKNVSLHYNSSYLSEAFPGANVSPKSASNLLLSLGTSREKMVRFMKNFVEGSEFSIIDLTHVFSLSEGVISATLGHNSEGEYVPQVNLALILSQDKMQPSFFRMIPGCIRDVSIIPITLKESGIEKAIIIGDKGFFSETNLQFLDEQNLGYILPLKRTSSLIDYEPLKSGSRKALDGYFFFDERVIWYYERRVDIVTKKGRRINSRVIVFRDERLKTEEEKDYLTHVQEEKLTLEEYYERQFVFGTIAVITSSSSKPKEIFEHLKGRVEIELLFDTFKNLLHADRSYMRDNAHLEGWMFINFVSLLLYYRFYAVLQTKDLLARYSPKDVILHLSRIQELKIGNKVVLSEIPKASRILMEKLGIEFHIP